MKAKFLLAVTLVLALAIGSANANPTKLEVNKTTTEQNFSKDGKVNSQIKHHRHHRKHHHHHHMMMKH